MLWSCFLCELEVDFDQGSIDPKILLEDQGQAVGDKKCVRRVGDLGQVWFLICPKFNFCSFTLLRESQRLAIIFLCIHFYSLPRPPAIGTNETIVLRGEKNFFPFRGFAIQKIRLSGE